MFLDFIGEQFTLQDYADQEDQSNIMASIASNVFRNYLI